MKHTPEQVKAWKARLREMAHQIKAMPPADREALALKLGTITPEGHRLSQYNTLFLWLQTGRATPQAGGFRQWLKAGRIVKRGEHAAGVIFVPLCRHRPENNPGSANPEALDDAATKIDDSVKFKLVPVFSIEQTDSIEKPNDKKEI